MKLYGLNLFFLAGLFFLFSCPDPPIPPIHSMFEGYYEGEYLIIENFSDPSSQIMSKEKVIRIMTDFTYDCTADTLDIDFPPITCDFFGSYAVENNLVLGTATSKRNRECNPDDLPSGEFAVRRSPNDDGLDSLIFTHLDLEQNQQKLIKLKILEDSLINNRN